MLKERWSGGVNVDYIQPTSMEKLARSGSGKSICQGHDKTGTSPPHFVTSHSETHSSVCSQSLNTAGGDGDAP